MIKICLICKKQYNVQPNRFQESKYCSKECRIKSIKRITDQEILNGFKNEYKSINEVLINLNISKTSLMRRLNILRLEKRIIRKSVRYNYNGLESFLWKSK